LPRGARPACRWLPHALPGVQDRARLPARAGPRARRRRPRLRVLRSSAMPVFETFLLPDAGEGLTEAEIVQWHVAVGDAVTVNQTIVESETAKSLVALPSPWAGVVSQVLVAEGTTVDVGTPIIVVDVDPGGPPAAAPD